MEDEGGVGKRARERSSTLARMNPLSFNSQELTQHKIIFRCDIVNTI